MKSNLAWLGARLMEPSTYAGMGVLLGMVGLNLDPGVAKDLAMIGTGLGGLIAFVAPEGK